MFTEKRARNRFGGIRFAGVTHVFLTPFTDVRSRIDHLPDSARDTFKSLARKCSKTPAITYRTRLSVEVMFRISRDNINAVGVLDRWHGVRGPLRFRCGKFGRPRTTTEQRGITCLRALMRLIAV